MPLEKTSGRGVSNSYGPRTAKNSLPTQVSSEIAAFLRKTPRFDNAFINEYPTLLAKPYDRLGTQLFTSSTLTNGGTEAVDTSIIDPTTGSPMSKLVLPNLTTGYQSLNYYDRNLGFFEEDDVWLLSVYIPAPIQTTCNIQLLTTDDTSIIGTNIRTFQFTASALQRGYNILAMLQVETAIGASTYGTVGTTMGSNWTDRDFQNKDTAINSMRMRVVITAGAAGDTAIYFGAIHKAPKGWSKGAVIWSADDVPASFHDIAIPIIESYGWKTTLNASVGLMESSSYISLNQYKDLMAQGHEVWGHTYNHENLVDATPEDETRVLTISRNFWNGVGIPTAARYMAYPQGSYNDDTITVLKSLNYKLGSTVEGRYNIPWIPAINPFTISRFTAERQNSWQVDAILNGGILRGQCMFTYMHTAVEGGSHTNQYPGIVSFYADHLKRWCDLVKSHEEQNRVIVCTASEYYKLCGVDPLVDAFLE